MFAALFAPAAPAPFSMRATRTDPRVVAANRRVLAAGVVVILPRRDAAAYYVDLSDPRPRAIPFRSWPERAACRGKEDELFFREDNDASATKRRSFSESSKVCKPCVVIADCLMHALTQPEEFGVWGGTHGQQRKAILARIESGETTLEREIAQCLQ